jgi:hypothetical protein
MYRNRDTSGIKQRSETEAASVRDYKPFECELYLLTYVRS